MLAQRIWDARTLTCLTHMLAAQGADTVIYERLDLQHPVNKELREVTRAHMEEFGAGGLRTLCLSYAELDHEEYDR